MNQTDTIVYYNGNYIPKRNVCISPDDRGFYFADGVYEVIRSYYGTIFYCNEHLQRLQYSLKAIQIPFSETNSIELIIKELLRKNNMTKVDAMIYIQITRGVYPRIHKFPEKKIAPTVYISVSIANPDIEGIKNGISVITVPDTRWARCDIKTIALLPNILAKQQAIEANAKEALFVKNNIITEGTHTGVFGVYNKKIITHPQNSSVLPSITTLVVKQLCTKLNLPIEERPLTIEELNTLDELFIVGTITEITPVIKVNNQIINNGKPGNITLQLQRTFNLLTNGTNATGSY